MLGARKGHLMGRSVYVSIAFAGKLDSYTKQLLIYIRLFSLAKEAEERRRYWERFNRPR